MDENQSDNAAALAAATKARWHAFQQKFPEFYDTLTDKQRQLISQYWFGSEYAYQLSLKDCKYLPPFALRSDQVASRRVNIHELLEQHAAHLIWQQQIEKQPIENILQQTSKLADELLTKVINQSYQQIADRYGEPKDANQKTMPLYILALGKLGGMELNFSSDVDLIFAYPEDGLIIQGNKEITHQEFFTKVVQAALQILQPHNGANRLYRVDLRLRPYGNSGALVSSFAALEKYYQEQGRDWERYALLKTRIINDDKNTQPLKTLLMSFVYRRYLDFTVFAALRDLKQTIRAQSKVASLEQDIKRGEGGIREIEFIVQALQITKGGRVKSLQTTSLLQGLTACEKEKLLTTEQVKHLKSAYLFYRTLENCLQMFEDKQVHHLPEDQQTQERITVAFGYHSWQAILDELDQHQQHVSAIFQQIIMPSIDEDKSSIDVMALDLSEQQLKNALATIGIHHEQDIIYEVINGLRQYIFSREASAEAKKRMSKLLPKIFQALSKKQHPGQILKTLQPLLISISLRSAYLVLLLENPNTLNWLIDLADTSEWIIARITEFPMLLDELLDPQSIVKEDIGTTIAADDTEAQMQYLREFKLRNELIVAIKQLDHSMRASQVSETLTTIATTITQQIYHWAWQQVVARYGLLEDAPSIEQSKCIIVAYGNLGGYAMNYQSDLDLVLIFDIDQNNQTNGKKSISALEFYAKLFQRMLTMLTSRTTSGVLYDIDTRLRPLGNEGLLVVTLDGFLRYQQEKAWTYEHQSLVRARVVAGDADTAQQFNRYRQKILQMDKDSKKLKKDIINMHERITIPEEQQITSIKQVKNCPGGIVDIDFMVQYAVLNMAKDYPQLLENTHTVAILESIAKLKIWPDEMAEQLAAIYQFYQECVLAWTLTGKLANTQQDKLFKQQNLVKQYWQIVLEDGYE